MEFGYFAMPSHPAGEGPEGRPRLGPPDPALARRTGLRRGLDRRAPHRALGAASRARPADRPGAVADQAHPHRAGRLPAALSSPGGTGQPRRDARSPVRGAAEFRRRRVGAAERLGDVPRRRHVRRQPRDDARVARHHPAAVERRAGFRLRRQVLEGGEAARRCSASCSPHIYPLQKPHPPIGVAGLSKQSDTLKLAGERGFLPMSLNLNPGLCGEPLGGGGDRRRSAPGARRTAATGGWCARCSSPTPTRRRGGCRSAA